MFRAERGLGRRGVGCRFQIGDGLRYVFIGTGLPFD